MAEFLRAHFSMNDSRSQLQSPSHGRDSLEAGELTIALSRAQIEAALARREAVLRAASGAAQRFLSGDWRDSVCQLLRDLGQGADVSRTYLFENVRDEDGEIRHFQRYEWCAPGVAPQIDNPDLQDFTLESIGLGAWQPLLSSDKVACADAAELSERAQQECRRQRIVSLVVVPVTVHGQWWGFLGFDECRARRVWETIEVETLRLSADIVAAAIARERMDEALRASQNEMQSLFDSMRDPVFVIDREGVYRKVVAQDTSLLARPELVGLSIAEVLGEEKGAQFGEVIAQVLDTGQMQRLEYALDISGEEKWFSASVTPLSGERVLWIARDVTQAHEARESIKRSERLFRLLAENSSDCIASHRADGTLLYISPVVEQMFGYAPAELENRDNFDLVHPDFRAELLQAMARVMEQPGVYQTREFQLRHKSGRYVWIETTGHAIRNENGETEVHSVSRDVTERRHAEVALRAAEEKYRSIFEHAVEGIFQTTVDGHYLNANPSLARIYGYETPAQLKANYSDIAQQLYVDPRKRAEFMAEMEASGSVSNFEAQIRRRDDSVIWISENAREVRDASGQLLYYEGTVEDITARKTAEDRLLHDALHDRLTGLANRALFMDRLGQAFARLKRHPDMLFAVLFLDFDRFKNINDSLGHLAGDELLVSIAGRLHKALRPGDTVSRFGGDEFALLLEDVRDVSDATLVAERVQSEMRLPFQLAGQEVFSSASIGIALGHPEYEHAEDLLRDADMAMYRAKALGKARHEVFDAEMHTRAVALLQLETDLRWAIERDEFRLHYQPIVTLESGAITGFEALIRWQHPERGLVSPAEFVPIAEETGWIVPIGKWVMQEACGQLAKWQAETGADPPLNMSVNLSGKQFSQPDLIELIQEVLQQTGVAPGCLKLEITESAIMENAQAVTDRLLQLRQLGLRLGLDDFGTGYSSLSYLHRFPLDRLKIDRSFIARLMEGGENLEIVRTIVALGKNLGMEVVAEGVEEIEQLEELRGLDCQHGQGFFFARPLPAEAALEMLRAKPRW